MKLEFIGVGEAFHHEMGNSSILLSGRNIPNLLFDCGYQVPERLWARGESEGLDGVYITHTHADHVFGLVPLLTKYVIDKRQKKLTIIGRKGIKNYIKKIMECGYRGVWERICYPLEIIEISSREKLNWQGLDMQFARSEHIEINYSVKVELPDGKSFAISGDGQMTSATKKLFAGVDVLVHELFQIEPKEGHTDFVTLDSFAKQYNVGCLIITHVSSEELARVKDETEWTIATPDLEVLL